MPVRISKNRVALENIPLNLSPEVDVASATTCNIGAATSNNVRITGTTTITAFDSVSSGVIRLIRFGGALTLTHNAASLILPGGANITTASGDSCLAVSLGSGNWIVHFYQATNAGIATAAASQAEMETGTETALRSMSPLRVAQAIAARSSSVLASQVNLIVKNNATNPNFQISVTVDEIILKTAIGGVFYLATNVNLIADITISGTNGLDTGVEANSTWYYVWVIYNGTTVASLLSTSSTAPTMPSGYIYKAIASAFFNDGSGNFIGLEQNDKEVTMTANRSIFDGTSAAGAWTAISVTNFFPTTAKRIKTAFGYDTSSLLGLSAFSSGAGGEYSHGSAGTGVSSPPNAPTARGSWRPMSCLYKGSVYYFTGAASGFTILATGWSY